MAVFAALPLLKNSGNEKAQGIAVLQVSAPYAATDGSLITRAISHARIVDGSLVTEAGTPLEVTATPSGVGLEMWLRIDEPGSGVGRYEEVRWLVAIPATATVAIDTLVRLEPADVYGAYVPSPEVQALLDAATTTRNEAAASASAAATSATTAGTARDEAVSARNAAQAVGTTTDGVMTGVDGNAASTFRVQSDARLSATFLARTGALQRLRDAGDGLTAAVDVRHRGTSGYLFHAVTEAGSAGFLQAYGTDEGNAGAVLRSHKNGSASEHAIGHGGSSILNYWQGYSASSVLTAEVFKGNQGIKVVSKTGQGFGDGVTTSGSTTFTSASAAFVSGDIGKTISQTTSRGSVAVSGSIPAGTTITAVASATSVTLSAAAGASSTTIPFLIAGRMPDVTQPLISFYDDNGTTLLGQIRRSGVDFFSTASTSAASFSITSGGVMAARAGSSLSNILAPGQNGLTLTNYQPGMHSLFIRGVASQTGDQLHIEDSTGAIQSRINKDGYIMTRKSTPPLVGDMANNELTVHVDGTAGAEKVYHSIRNSAGALVTKQVAYL